MDVRMQIEIQKILEYRDIFPNEALLDIDCILKKYNRDLLIRIVNALGMNYGMRTCQIQRSSQRKVRLEYAN